nr:hypothetical protein [Tanacetum cinerariifolium]
MLNKENYVPWSLRLLQYAKSRPNGKLIHNSIINGPYVRWMILEPGDPNRKVPVNKTFHVQTDDELTEKELKQIEADDQAIQTILLAGSENRPPMLNKENYVPWSSRFLRPFFLGLLEDIYAAVDSCETAQEIWLRVQQMIKGSNLRIQEKKAKLFNEWESLDEEEDTRSSHEYLNDLEEEYQGRALLAKSKRFFKKADESSVFSTLLLSLKKLDGVELVSGPKTIKLILKLKSTFKAETLKGITINEPSSDPARGKSSLAFKTNSAHIDLSSISFPKVLVLLTSIASSSTKSSSSKDQTNSVSEGFETVLTQPITGKGASLVARKIIEETPSIIKLEDLTELVSQVQPSFINSDLPEDDPVSVVDDTDEDEEDEIHATTNAKIEDTLVPKSSSQSSQIQELTNQDLPSKFNEPTEEVKWLKNEVYELEITLPEDLKEIPTKLKDFKKTEEKGKKKSLSLEEEEKESTDSDSDDETPYVTGFMVEPSKIKKLKKFDIITEYERHIHLTKEEINHQKKLEEDAKAKRDEFKKFAANFVELDKLHKSKVLGFQAEISKQQRMHSDLEKSCSLIEQNHIALQALEIALSQLKAQLASAHIQLNSYKAENKTLSQRYEELAKSNMASRVQLSGRITALTTEN